MIKLDIFNRSTNNQGCAKNSLSNISTLWGSTLKPYIPVLAIPGLLLEGNYDKASIKSKVVGSTPESRALWDKLDKKLQLLPLPIQKIISNHICTKYDFSTFFDKSEIKSILYEALQCIIDYIECYNRFRINLPSIRYSATGGTYEGIFGGFKEGYKTVCVNHGTNIYVLSNGYLGLLEPTPADSAKFTLLAVVVTKTSNLQYIKASTIMSKELEIGTYELWLSPELEKLPLLYKQFKKLILDDWKDPVLTKTDWSELYTTYIVPDMSTPVKMKESTSSMISMFSDYTQSKMQPKYEISSLSTGRFARVTSGFDFDDTPEIQPALGSYIKIGRVQKDTDGNLIVTNTIPEGEMFSIGTGKSVLANNLTLQPIGWSPTVRKTA